MPAAEPQFIGGGAAGVRALEGRRVLCFIFQRITPPENGLHIAVWNRLESLAALGAEVHLLTPQAWRPRTAHWSEASRRDTEAKGIRMHFAPAHAGTLDFWWAAAWQVFVKKARRVVWPRPDSAYYWRPQLTGAWRRLLRGGRFDAAWVNYANWSRLIPAAREAGATTVIEAHELLSHQYAARLRLAGRPEPTAAQSAAYFDSELRTLGTADLVITLNEAEAAVLRDGGVSNARFVPVGVAAPSVAGAPVETDLLVVGSHIENNKRGLAEFVREAWPKMLAERPETRMTVCGGVGEALTGSEPNVTWIRFAPDLGVHYAGAKIALLTTVAGAGVKIKAIEAMAHGCCIVGHEHSVTALGFEAGVHGLTVAAMKDAAAPLLALLADPARRAALGIAARGLFDRRFSETAVRDALGRAVLDAMKRRSAVR
jgi:glycosyltransferase involved in cell wall biosynthesis